jgi:hypothetical protein
MVRVFIFLLSILPLSLLAQVFEFAEPVKLGANINTPYEEVSPLLSPDGKVLYFTRILYPDNIGGKFSGPDIWISTYDVTIRDWGKSKVPPEGFNDKGSNAVIGVSRNGSTIYLFNGNAKKKANGIYFSNRLSNNTWSRPELIPIPGLEPDGFIGFYVSPDFDVIFLSMKGVDSRGEEDLYVTIRNNSGTWSVPKNLGAAINTPGYEISPYLSQDKRRLYFSSNGHKGLGDADIFFSDRLYDSWDTWSTPRNLGEVVNSANFDAYFSMYGDTVAYFSSNRSGKMADIYRTTVSPGNEVLASGHRYLSSEETNSLIGSKVPRQFIFEGKNTELSAAQKELIFFVINKLSQDEDVNLQLTVTEENDKALSDKRLTAVEDQFKLTGLRSSRMLRITSPKNKKEGSSRTVITMSFFK